MNMLMGADNSFEIKEYSYLTVQLKLFYFCYADFNLKKNRTFVDSIIDTTKTASILPSVNFSFLPTAIISKPFSTSHV